MKIKFAVPIISLLMLSCSGNESFETRYSKVLEINKKYEASNLKDVNKIESSKLILHKFVSSLRTYFGSDKVPDVDRITDSLYNVLLLRNKIDIDQYKIDTAEIRRILPSYLNGDSLPKDDDRKVSIDIAVAFANDLQREYDDVFHYIEKGYFINGENQNRKNETYTPSVSKSDVEKWMVGFNGQIRDFEDKVISKLNDPDSYKHIETSYSVRSYPPKVRLKFSAKNSFNATVTSTAEGLLNIEDGTVSNIKIK